MLDVNINHLTGTVSHTSSLPLLLPAAIRFPLSSMAQTALSQSPDTADACVPVMEEKDNESFSGFRGPAESPKLGLLWI